MNELFNGISDACKLRILQELEALTRKFDKNKIILSSVKNDNILCLLQSGHVHVTKNDPSGNSVVIENLTDGDVFGSISANISSCDYEIVTKEESVITIIEVDNIFNFDIRIPEYDIFVKNLLKVLYNKINEFNNHIEILTNKSIRDKLLAYFRIMTNAGENRIIYLPLNYSELADYLAVNRSAMAREFKALKDEGFIETKGRKIKLLY